MVVPLLLCRCLYLVLRLCACELGLGPREVEEKRAGEAAEEAEFAAARRTRVCEACVEALLQGIFFARCYAFAVARLYYVIGDEMRGGSSFAVLGRGDGAYVLEARGEPGPFRFCVCGVRGGRCVLPRRFVCVLRRTARGGWFVGHAVRGWGFDGSVII